MSKTELVEFMAEEAGMSKAEAGRALEAWKSFISWIFNS